MCLATPLATWARQSIITPKWHTEESTFRRATINENGGLTDSYMRKGCDTVNIIDTQAGRKYDMTVYANITNLHNNTYSRYPQYYYNSKGKLCKETSAERPIYGWVVGMKDMQHYNAILMRPTLGDDILYENPGIEYRVVTINGNDTIYHCEWKSCYYNTLVNKSSQYTMWIQYSNDVLRFGGGWSHELPWDMIYNIPTMGPYTGLYLSSGAKVSIDDAFIIIDDKEVQPRTPYTSETLDSYYSNNRCAFVEGFWDVVLKDSSSKTIKMGGNYSLGIVNNGFEYYMIYLEGAEIYPGKWNEGDVKAILTPHESGYYNVVWYDAEGYKIENVMAFLEGDILRLNFIDEDTQLTLTRSKKYITTSQPTTSFGSGFAITSDGYLATNFHVVRDAKQIDVLCLNREFPQSFNAEIVVADSINDLAILRINDDNFISFGELPYSISNRMARKGESVFYMGYPRPTLLDIETKTSTGQITAIAPSRSTYMVSIDIDSGSSGSPVFDNEGNVIGVIVSQIPEQYTSIEANFAVKSQYLLNLIEKVEDVKLQQNNTIKELSHPDRIEAIAPYILFLSVGL